MSKDLEGSRIRTHAVSFCREKCAEYSFRTSEEFKECVELCVKEIQQLSRR